MLPKELFLSTLEKIKEQEKRIDKFNTALSKICDGFPVFNSENQYLIALRDLLKYTMQDQYVIISGGGYMKRRMLDTRSGGMIRMARKSAWI